MQNLTLTRMPERKYAEVSATIRGYRLMVLYILREGSEFEKI
jgi:hypothetical protein